MAAPAVPAAAGGKRKLATTGATAKNKKGKDQGSSSKATPAPEDVPAKRQRKPVQK